MTVNVKVYPIDNYHRFTSISKMSIISEYNFKDFKFVFEFGPDNTYDFITQLLHMKG